MNVLGFLRRPEAIHVFQLGGFVFRGMLLDSKTLGPFKIKILFNTDAGAGLAALLAQSPEW